MSNVTVNFEEMKAIADNPNVLIIDVRNPEEVKSTGRIGNSINIPALDVPRALNEAKETFEEKYRRQLPSTEDTIIFHCQKGARALKAWESAVAQGFKNAKYYPGSYSEWLSKNEKV